MENLNLNHFGQNIILFHALKDKNCVQNMPNLSMGAYNSKPGSRFNTPPFFYQPNDIGNRNRFNSNAALNNKRFASNSYYNQPVFILFISKFQKYSNYNLILT